MFHIGNDLYAGRVEPGGDVRLIQFNSAPSSAPWSGMAHTAAMTFDVVIPATVWCSVMAAVSNRGEIEGRFYVAQAFHQNIEALAAWNGVAPA